MFLIALAERLRVPSIALLLIGGVVLGPEVLGLVQPGALGAGLETVVTIAVAVILFEGGLTLDVAGFRREPTVIVRLLTVGVLVTWLGAALALMFTHDLSPPLALIGGSLVIVTGPTVVSPVLRRIGIQPRLHHVLYWEGVLVDAVGVFVAVLCFEWMVSQSDLALASSAGRFAIRVLIGVGFGGAAGLALAEMIRRHWIPSRHVNIVVLGGALLTLGAANALVHESGILAVIVAGLVLALRLPRLEQIKTFKLELTEVAIGLLFVLLAARLDLGRFTVEPVAMLTFLGILLLVVRPLNVLLSTAGQSFSWREKLFLSWLAPRGIVAASMASLFAIRLADSGVAGASTLETMVYAVIATTVLVQGLSAGAVASALKLKRTSRATWLLIGETQLAVMLHRRLRQVGVRSLVLGAGQPVDEEDSVETLLDDPFSPDDIRDPRIADVEAVLVLAPDTATNDRLCEAWIPVVGDSACFRWDHGDVVPDVGRRVWTDLPGPGQLLAAMEDNQYAIEAIEVGSPEDAQRFGDAVRPLFAEENGHVQVVDRPHVLAGGAAVALRRRVPGLYGLVRDAVIFDSHQMELKDIMEVVLSRAKDIVPELDLDAHLAEILDRETHMPTAIGQGVAVPHVYDPHATRSVCVLAHCVRGLDVETPDDEPVRLVFLIVSPANQAASHLKSLGAIARVAEDRDLCQTLMRQRTRGRLLTILRERE